jgi:hypothetical protein
MERRIQRAGLVLEHLFGCPLDAPGDRVTVGEAEEQRAKDEEIERALPERLVAGGSQPGGFGVLLGGCV